MLFAGSLARPHLRRVENLLDFYPRLIVDGSMRDMDFFSIFVFAAMLGGVSEEQVRKVINREQQFENAPAMKNLLISGAVSLSKINAVATIVTPENDAIVAQKAVSLSRASLETWVRDVKNESKVPGELVVLQSGLVVNEPPLSDVVKTKLNDLANKNIDINEIILNALNKREAEIAEEKKNLAEKAQAKLIEQITEEKIITRAITDIRSQKRV